MAEVEKSEEQIAKEKAAVEAMRNAKSHMDAALARISTLERALSQASSDIRLFKTFIGASAYVYDGRQSVHTAMESSIANIAKVIAA